MSAKKQTSRGAIAGVIFLLLAWAAGIVWYLLPYYNSPPGFPQLSFSPPAADAAGAEPEEGGAPRGAKPGSLAIDSLVTQERGYSVTRSDFGMGARLYDRREFDAAQQQAESLYGERNNGRHGAVYSGYLNALGRLDNEENVDNMLGTLSEWRKAYPESHFALMVEAILRMNLADAIRAGRWSTSIGRAAVLGYDSNVHQAEILLEEAREKQPDDAQPAIELMRAAVGMDMAADEIEAYFQYAHERSPHSYAMWRQNVRILAPRRGTSWDEMNARMKQAEAEAATDPQVEMVIVDGLVEMHERGVAGIDLSGPEQWRQVADIYDRVLNHYPDDLEILQLYAQRAAQYCPDPAETATLFDRIGDRYYDGGEWESLDQYNQARTHAYVGYARLAEGSEAAERMEKAFRLSPDDWYVAYHYGVSRAKLNDMDNALAALVRAVDTNPSFVPAINAAAHVYLHRGDYENAEIYANRAIVRQPLGKLHYEAQAMLDDAVAMKHKDTGQPLVSHVD